MNQDSYEDKVQNKFLNFLIEFTLDDEPFYQKLAKQMYENNKTTLMLNYNHLQSQEGYDDICQFLHSEFYR